MQTNEAEQVFMGEFLESCRATSLLAQLEDDEKLPVAHEVEENEEDCNDSEDCLDNYDDEGLYSKAGKMHRVSEPTYVIVYREVKENLQMDETSLSSSRRSSSLPKLPITSSTSCSMDEVLQ